MPPPAALCRPGLPSFPTHVSAFNIIQCNCVYRAAFYSIFYRAFVG
jgi:hypothetical protein